MAMVLDHDVRVFLLYAGGELGEESRTSDARHVLETYFIATVFHYLVDNAHVVVNRMDRRVRDRKSDLRNHAALLRVFDAEAKVAMVVQTAE